VVSDALVSPNQIIPGQFAQMQGVFDQNTWHQVPVANITLKSPRFGTDKEIVVQAAVCALPDNVNCLIENNLFKQFPELSDIVSVRPQRSPGVTTSTRKLQQHSETDRKRADNPERSLMPSVMDDSSVIAQVTQEVDNLTESGQQKDDFNLEEIKSSLVTDVSRPPSAINSINFPVERSSVIRYDLQWGGVQLNRGEGSIDGDHAAVAAVDSIDQTVSNKLSDKRPLQSADHILDGDGTERVT